MPAKMQNDNFPGKIILSDFLPSDLYLHSLANEKLLMKEDFITANFEFVSIIQVSV